MSCYVGIDLGTTNSAIAYIDPSNAGDQAFPPVHIQQVAQPVAEGRVEAVRTLPSFLYLSEPPVAGVWAREQGALTPTKLVHSAKSWLSNPQVDRTARILPWDAAEGGRLYSPVDASARYIEDLRKAWEKEHGASIGDQDVVLTVPASFDEEARELTVAAARRAGIEKLTLLEEPAAAFYAWIANHLERSRAQLRDGMLVLVCDVGGGTSDFTLIRIERAGDRIDFTRTAVGQHLLLGGDNLDLTISWLAEQKLNAQLNVRQRSALRRQCSAAKEKLLTEGGPERAEITVLGAGRSLIGGTLRTFITREEALELALDGFVPECARDEKPAQEEMSAFGETGLPYVPDPAVTRHLAAFLAASGHVAPDAILFNGGFFIPPVLRERVARVVESWTGRKPLVMENNDLDLAVAVGAAYYSYVRSTGAGLVVRGGLPRTYYLGLDSRRAVTVVPRGTENGETLELDQDRLELVANKPVSFRLYSSLTRMEDARGAMVDISEELHQHAPLHAVIRFGKPGETRQVPVKLVAKLTEVGTLELWADSKVSGNRWRLQFELRKQAGPAAAQPAAVISEEALRTAQELVRDCFERSMVAPEELPARLEQAMSLGRASWPLTAIRKLADQFLELAGARRNGPAYEARWLNLAGLCLRPGFGFPGDEYRVEQARRLFAQGLVFPNQVQNECEWWIFWGRVAGGLNRNQQSDMFQRLSGTLTPRKNHKVRVNSSLLREMWRAAASLELLPVGTKTELGDTLLRHVAAGTYKESELWCLSRIGARQLFYGPINAVTPPATAQRWVDALRPVKGAEAALAAIARRTGDATRDVPPVMIESLRRSFEGHPKEETLVAALDGRSAGDREFLSRVFGEDLPSGLTLAAGTQAGDE
ncbi:MAG: Hsp70 family protein [Bryobacterales bacterium]|nr:Hsp70 family protein [Bryobacterales bacterium]